MIGNRNLRVGFSLIFAMVVFSRSVLSLESGGTVAGVVKSASGEPVAGAMVKVRNNDRSVTFTVISQGQGRYTISNLPSGKYTVQGLGGGFQNDPKLTVEVIGSRTVTGDLTLSTPQDFQEAMTASQFAELISDDSLRHLLIAECSDCHHSMQRIVPRRLNQEGWISILEKMRHATTLFGYYRSYQVTDQRRDEIASLLAKNFGPDTPPLDVKRLLPKTWVAPEAAKVAIVEYDIPSGAVPHDVAVDSKGVGWVTESEHSFVGRLDPVSHTYTRIPIPGEKKSRATANAIDEPGRLWFGDPLNSRVVQYDPRTQAFTDYPIPKPPHGGTGLNTIRFHPSGTVWMTNQQGDQILRLDPRTKQFTAYPIPTAVASKMPVAPYGLAIDGNHNVWFAERQTPDQVDRVGKVDPETGKVTEYEVPTRGAVLRRMATDAEGNLWFGEFGGGKLGMIDYRTAKITEYTTPTKYSGPYSIDVDKKHNLIWVDEMLADKIAKFDPRTKTFVEYPLPTHYSSVRRIELDPNRPNRIWYTGYNVDKVGYMEIIE